MLVRVMYMPLFVVATANDVNANPKPFDRCPFP